jgi:hypothetical protein
MEMMEVICYCVLDEGEGVLTVNLPARPEKKEERRGKNDGGQALYRTIRHGSASRTVFGQLNDNSYAGSMNGA